MHRMHIIDNLLRDYKDDSRADTTKCLHVLKKNTAQIEKQYLPHTLLCLPLTPARQCAHIHKNKINT